MNEQQQQGPSIEQINKILSKFQNKLSEATTQVILLEAELDDKNTKIEELQRSISEHPAAEGNSE